MGAVDSVLSEVGKHATDGAEPRTGSRGYLMGRARATGPNPRVCILASPTMQRVRTGQTDESLNSPLNQLFDAGSVKPIGPRSN